MMISVQSTVVYTGTCQRRRQTAYQVILIFYSKHSGKTLASQRSDFAINFYFVRKKMIFYRAHWTLIFDSHGFYSKFSTLSVTDCEL